MVIHRLGDSWALVLGVPQCHVVSGPAQWSCTVPAGTRAVPVTGREREIGPAPSSERTPFLLMARSLGSSWL